MLIFKSYPDLPALTLAAFNFPQVLRLLDEAKSGKTLTIAPGIKKTAASSPYHSATVRSFAQKNINKSP